MACQVQLGHLALWCTLTWWEAILGGICPLKGCTCSVITFPVSTHSPHLCLPLPSVYAFLFWPGKKKGTEIVVFLLWEGNVPQAGKGEVRRAVTWTTLEMRGLCSCMSSHWVPTSRSTAKGSQQHSDPIKKLLITANAEQIMKGGQEVLNKVIIGKLWHLRPHLVSSQ